MRKLRINVETHVRELEAHISIQATRRDFGKQLSIKMGAVARFFRIGYIFSEIVDRNTQSHLIQGLRDPQRIFNLSASNEAAGNTLSDGGSFSHCPERAAFRKRNKERPQHGSPENTNIFLLSISVQITESCITNGKSRPL